MREILFRGKDVKEHWSIGLLAHIGNAWYISNGAGIPTAYEVIPSTIGQYTGMNDRNDTKIFEGDIVKYHNTYPKAECTAVVKFGKYEQDGSFGEYEPTKCIGYYANVRNYVREVYAWEDGRLSPYLLQRNLLEVAKKCEVIGNIYDNPELLKESEE